MEYAVNLIDGRIVAFNEEVAKQTSYAHVPEDIAHSIADGAIDWKAVAELIHKKRNNDPTFSWEAFDTLRDHQNIRKAKYDPVEPEKASEPVPDSVPQVEISMAELTRTGANKHKAADNVSAGDSVASRSEPTENANSKKVLI